MQAQCEVAVDYVTQKRKPTRKRKAIVSLGRDEWENICLALVSSSKKEIFKLEDTLRRVYGDQASKGKVTLELHLQGGSKCHIILSCNTEDDIRGFEKLVEICTELLNDPDKVHMRDDINSLELEKPKAKRAKKDQDPAKTSDPTDMP